MKKNHVPAKKKESMMKKISNSSNQKGLKKSKMVESPSSDYSDSDFNFLSQNKQKKRQKMLLGESVIRGESSKPSIPKLKNVKPVVKFF